MTTVQALILGTIQGLTEFLPVSSSGHLIFIPALFGWADQGLAFDVVLHLGTLVAVVFYFRKTLVRLFRALWTKQKTEDSVLARYVLWSVIPAGLAGFFFGDMIEASLRSATIVAWSLIGWAGVLAAADGWNKGLEKAQKTISLTAMGWRQAAFVALAQILALVPGTSRSGITMTAGLFAGLNKKSAAEFSFLMSVPVIFLAGAAKMAALSTEVISIPIEIFLIGFIASTLSGFLAIWTLMKIIQKWSFMPFVAYRIVIGTLILFYLV